MACFVMSTLKQSLAVCHTLIIPIVTALMRIRVRNHFAKVTSTSSYSSNYQSKSKVTCKIGKMTCKIGQGYSTFPSTILVLSFVHGHLIYSLRSCCTLLGCEVNYLSFCNYQSYSVYKTFTIFFTIAQSIVHLVQRGQEAFTALSSILKISHSLLGSTVKVTCRHCQPNMKMTRKWPEVTRKMQVESDNFEHCRP